MAVFASAPLGNNAILSHGGHVAQRQSPDFHSDHAIVVGASSGRWFEVEVQETSDRDLLGLELGVTTLPPEKLPSPLPNDLGRLASRHSGQIWCFITNDDGEADQCGLIGDTWQNDIMIGIPGSEALCVGDVVRFGVHTSGHFEVLVNDARAAIWTSQPPIPQDAVLHPLLNVQGTTTRVRFLSVRESFCPDSGDNSVPIRREIQSVWEAFFADDERKDVTLQLPDGTEVLAHGSLLMAASPVFKAMLSHDMEEKQRHVIKLPGFSRAEVRFFLRLVYTGGVEPGEWDDECSAAAKPESAAGIRDGPLVTDPEKPPLSLLCGGFSFGKQYMFEDVALFILEKIQGRLAEDTLDYILALAIREDVTSLRLASLRLAQESASIRQRVEMDQDSFAPQVLHELRPIFQNAMPVRKRKFEFS